MRIIVMGAGAIGGIIGGRLGYAGNDVTLVDVSPEQVQAIRKNGLEVVVPDGPFKVSLAALFPEEIAGRFDVAFIAVRPQNTPEALLSLKSHLNQGAILVTLQNGVNSPLIEESVGPGYAVNTVIRMRSRLAAPGRVETKERGHLYIGHFHGMTTPQLVSVQALLNSVIPTEISDNILGLRWSKLTYNSLLTFGALADVPLKTIWQSERNRQLSVDFMAEMTEIGVSSGVRFENLKEYNPSDFHPDLPHEARYSTFSKVALNWKNDRPSTSATRLKRGLKTEADTTIETVVEIGQKLGIATPVSCALCALIREIESGKRRLQLDNYDDLANVVYDLRLYHPSNHSSRRE